MSKRINVMRQAERSWLATAASLVSSGAVWHEAAAGRLLSAGAFCALAITTAAAAWVFYRRAVHESSR